MSVSNILSIPSWFSKPTVFWLILPLLISNAYAEPEALPTTADISRIYNIEKAADQRVDVIYYRKKECDDKLWCSVKGSGEYLKPKDFLQTGQVSRADLALMYTQQKYNEVLFWQQEGSRSEFLPQAGTCHFKVDTGGFIYVHPHVSISPGCEKIISKNALVFPNGTALFIGGKNNSTLVGVLSNSPEGAIKIQHLGSDKTVELKAGEYAEARDNGEIIKGIFDLEDFYQHNRLALGLGPEKVDQEYVDRQEPEIQDILNRIRKETLAAIEQQDNSDLEVFDDFFNNPTLYSNVNGTGTGSTTGSGTSYTTSVGLVYGQ